MNRFASPPPEEAMKMIRYSQAVKERNEAISQAKFWRACTLVLAVTGFLSNLMGLGRLSGWW